jgi:hypothetical protein
MIYFAGGIHCSEGKCCGERFSLSSLTYSMSCIFIFSCFLKHLYNSTFTAELRVDKSHKIFEANSEAAWGFFDPGEYSGA